MPSWTNKDERKYEHIKESLLEKGEGEKLASEIAGRTVNKKRRQEGRTPNKTTQGTGNPNKPLAEHTLQELRNLAGKRHISGRSRMNKAELVRALGS